MFDYLPRVKVRALVVAELSKLFKSGTSFVFFINSLPVASKRLSSENSGDKLAIYSGTQTSINRKKFDTKV